MKDDRKEFEEHKIAQSLALGKDEGAFQRSIDTVLDLDRYDYSYLWSWMGVPIIQMPADVMATQEVIWPQSRISLSKQASRAAGRFSSWRPCWK